MDPATWIYLALLAASTAASAQAQHKTNKARAQVQAEETDRRKAQQKESEAAALRTQQDFLSQKEKTAAREAELAQTFAAKEGPAPITDAAGTRFLSTSAPTQSTATIDATKSEMARGRSEAARDATAKAQLGAFGDVLQMNNLAASRNAQDIGQSASFMQGWQQNVLPALYAKANTAGKDWATAADVMKLASAVMSFGALGAGGAPAAEGAKTTTGVLDQMSGVPKAFAGKDLFGMGEGVRAFGSNYGMDALLGAGGMGIVADPRLRELESLRSLGHMLSPEDQLYWQLAQEQRRAGMMH